MRFDLKLVGRLEFDSGAVAMRYEPRRLPSEDCALARHHSVPTTTRPEQSEESRESCNLQPLSRADVLSALSFLHTAAVLFDDQIDADVAGALRTRRGAVG